MWLLPAVFSQCTSRLHGCYLAPVRVSFPLVEMVSAMVKVAEEGLGPSAETCHTAAVISAPMHAYSYYAPPLPSLLNPLPPLPALLPSAPLPLPDSSLTLFFANGTGIYPTQTDSFSATKTSTPIFSIQSLIYINFNPRKQQCISTPVFSLSPLLALILSRPLSPTSLICMPATISRAAMS